MKPRSLMTVSEVRAALTVVDVVFVTVHCSSDDYFVLRVSKQEVRDQMKGWPRGYELDAFTTTPTDGNPGHVLWIG